MNDIERDLRRRLKKSIHKRTELNNRVLEYQKERQELIEYLKGQTKLCKEAQQFALDNKIIQQVGNFNLRIATYEEILNKIEKR